MMRSVFVAVVSAIDIVAWYRPQVALGAVGIGDQCIGCFAQQVYQRRIVIGARCSSVILGLLRLQRATDVAQLEDQVYRHAFGSRGRGSSREVAFPSRVLRTIDRLRPVAVSGGRKILEFIDCLRRKSGKTATVEY